MTKHESPPPSAATEDTVELREKLRRIMLHILESKSPECIRARNKIFAEPTEPEEPPPKR